MSKQIINKAMDAAVFDSALYCAASGYHTNIQIEKEIILTGGQARMCYLSAGKGIVECCGKKFPVQQHDVFFVFPQKQVDFYTDRSRPSDLWWIELEGRSIQRLAKKLSVSPQSPLIHGIAEPRFFQEIKSLVTSYDLSAESDQMHIASGLYKLFAILLDACTNSQWTSVPHDEKSILYTGEWKAWPSPFGKNHEEYYTAQPKAYAEFNFYGTGIKWYGTLNFDCGIADVIIDGNYVTTVDTYSPVRLTKQLLYSNTKLSFGHHIIKIFCTGKKNDKATNCDVTLESFQYSAGYEEGEKEETTLTASTQMVRKAVDIISHQYDRITVDALARMLDTNRSYFSSRFAAETGISPSQYIIKTRIEYAKLLLVKTDKPIQEIAPLVGVHDVFYFSKVFKSRENMSPTQYRRLHAKD